MMVLAAVRDAGLPQGMVFSGAVWQAALNALTGRAQGYGLKDYDVGYFDADTSWEAEDAAQRLVRREIGDSSLFRTGRNGELSLISALVEVRNQARVHLWFEDRFGTPYAPLGCAEEAMTRFTAPAFAVGARLEADGEITVLAPLGLDDLFALTLRPNPLCLSGGFAATAASAKARWPELVVLGT